MTLAAVAMALGGSLIIAVGRAGQRGLLTPGSWAGIRTDATQASEEAWYAAHEASATWVKLGGWVVTIAGLAILLTRPDTTVAAQIALLGTLLGTATILYGGFVGHRAAVAFPESGESTAS